ncbi:hypothetical protein CW304_22180 [Bacillus sp. UFRGS-B20]|nr:hypothetical protein CW304_22180 [Bacillus sp. UFRGS-B20]
MQGFLGKPLHLNYKHILTWNPAWSGAVTPISYQSFEKSRCFFRAKKERKTTPSQIYGIVLLNIDDQNSSVS